MIRSTESLSNFLSLTFSDLTCDQTIYRSNYFRFFLSESSFSLGGGCICYINILPRNKNTVTTLISFREGKRHDFFWFNEHKKKRNKKLMEASWTLHFGDAPKRSVINNRNVLVSFHFLGREVEILNSFPPSTLSSPRAFPRIELERTILIETAIDFNEGKRASGLTNRALSSIANISL